MLCACACLSWVNAVPRKVLWLSTGVVLVRVLRSRDTLLCSLCVLFAAKLMRSVPSAPVHNDQKDPVPVLHVIRCLIVGPPRQPFPCVACLAGRKGTQSYDDERSRLLNPGKTSSHSSPFPHALHNTDVCRSLPQVIRSTEDSNCAGVTSCLSLSNPLSHYYSFGQDR